MKKLLILLFSILILPVSVNAADVYYCSDTEKIGFDPKDNYSNGNYIPDKFKILIDFENKNVISSDIFLDERSDIKCVLNPYMVLYCINDYGTAFSISKNNLVFRKSIVWYSEGQTDDISISYGTCDKF